MINSYYYADNPDAFPLYIGYEECAGEQIQHLKETLPPERLAEVRVSQETVKKRKLTIERDMSLEEYERRLKFDRRLGRR